MSDWTCWALIVATFGLSAIVVAQAVAMRRMAREHATDLKIAHLHGRTAGWAQAREWLGPDDEDCGFPPAPPTHVVAAARAAFGVNPQWAERAAWLTDADDPWRCLDEDCPAAGPHGAHTHYDGSAGRP